MNDCKTHYTVQDILAVPAETREKGTMEMDNVPEGTFIGDWVVPENSIIEEPSNTLTGYMIKFKGVRNYRQWLEKCVTTFATKEEYEAETKRRENRKKEWEEADRKRREEEENTRHNSVTREIRRECDIDTKYEKFTFSTLDSDFANANFELLDFFKLYITTPFSKLRELGRGLYLYGNVGVGKTTLLCCLANAFIELEKKVVFASCVSLLDRIQDNGRYRNKLLNTPVLFLDDLSKTTVSDYYISTLFEIIDFRSANGLLTNFSNNSSLIDTIKQWKEKGKAKDETLHSLHSRLNGSVIEKEITGTDRRKTMSFRSFETLLIGMANENRKETK